jgi:CheY-like chemotaxis protein
MIGVERHDTALHWLHEGRVMTVKPANGFMPKVMLVDDDEDVREILGETLRMQDYDVQVCESGLQAVETISADTRVVILDLMMPGMDGRDTFRELQKKFPGVPVVFYSAYRSMLGTRELGKLHPLGFVDKGAVGSRQKVLELVRKALQGE